MLLVIRPEPGASATVQRAKAMDLDARAVPLFRVVPIDWTPPEAAAFDALLVTSANVFRHGGEGLLSLRGLPVHAVGAATADAAREAGFDVASSGDGGVDRLLDSIDPDLRLLHLCGADRRSPRDPRQAMTAIVVYRSEPVSEPALGDVADATIMVHSPRAGQRLAELVTDRGATAIAAISPAAAEACGAGWQTIEAAAEPTDSALLALAARLCQKRDQQ